MNLQKQQRGRRNYLQREIWRKLNRLGIREHMLESHQTHCGLADGPSHLLGCAKLRAGGKQIHNRSLCAAPAVFPVCKSNPSVRLKSPLQLRKLIEIQCHGKVDVSRMPEFTGEMHLVGDGTDDDKVCSERNAKVAKRADQRFGPQ